MIESRVFYSKVACDMTNVIFLKAESMDESTTIFGPVHVDKEMN